MSQLILNSNKASLVQNEITRDGSVVLSKANPLSYPNISKKVTAIKPYIPAPTSLANGGTATFNVPRAHMWYGARLKLIYTTDLTAASEYKKHYGLNAIRQIDLMCNGQSFMTLSGEAIKTLVADSNPAFQAHTYRYALACDATTELPATATGAVAYVSYVPLFGTWFQRPENAIDCSNTEQVQVVVAFKTTSETGLAVAMTNFDCELITYKYQIENDEYQKVLAENSKNTLMECYNTFTERMNCTGNLLTVQTFTSSAYFPIFKTYIFCAKNAVSVTDPVNIGLGCPYFPIRSVKVSVGGEDYIASGISRSTMDYERAIRDIGGFYGDSSGNIVAGSLVGNNTLTDNNNTEFIGMYVIDWSLKAGRDGNTGLCSFANLPRPQFEVVIGGAQLRATNAPTLTPIGEYSLYFVHLYWNVIQHDPATKVLSVQASH